jgi:hypothetical protein
MTDRPTQPALPLQRHQHRRSSAAWWRRGCSGRSRPRSCSLRSTMSRLWRPCRVYPSLSLKLCDSWDDDAVLGDRANGVWGDDAKVYPPAHVGRFHRVAGALDVPTSPQGYPLLVQAGSSENGARLRRPLRRGRLHRPPEPGGRAVVLRRPETARPSARPRPGDRQILPDHRGHRGRGTRAGGGARPAHRNPRAGRRRHHRPVRPRRRRRLHRRPTATPPAGSRRHGTPPMNASALLLESSMTPSPQYRSRPPTTVPLPCTACRPRTPSGDPRRPASLYQRSPRLVSDPEVRVISCSVADACSVGESASRSGAVPDRSITILQ